MGLIPLLASVLELGEEAKANWPSSLFNKKGMPTHTGIVILLQI